MGDPQPSPNGKPLGLGVVHHSVGVPPDNHCGLGKVQRADGGRLSGAWGTAPPLGLRCALAPCESKPLGNLPMFGELPVGCGSVPNAYEREREGCLNV